SLVNDIGLGSYLWIGPRARKRSGEGVFKAIGISRYKNEVGIFVDEDLRDQVVQVIRTNEMMMTIKLVIERHNLNIISAYAPQVVLDEDVKKHLLEELDKVVRGTPRTQNIVIGGEFNAQIGATLSRFGDICAWKLWFWR
ncbi:hypothetical protein H5410_061351, partial [Solanum commersonii]